MSSELVAQSDLPDASDVLGLLLSNDRASVAAALAVIASSVDLPPALRLLSATNAAGLAVACGVRRSRSPFDYLG